MIDYKSRDARSFDWLNISRDELDAVARRERVICWIMEGVLLLGCLGVAGFLIFGLEG
jgi:hypothetical protein